MREKCWITLLLNRKQKKRRVLGTPNISSYLFWRRISGDNENGYCVAIVNIKIR